jgi:tRNA A-37 threonylcarbamoyl transferase component Bud32
MMRNDNAIFRDITITWRGAEYSVTPSMRMMRTIEMGDVSITDVVVRTHQGRPPVSHIAYILAKMLQSVGVKATEDDVYEEMITGDEKHVSELVAAVINGFSPQTAEAKNPDARAEQPQARASKKSAR